MVFMVFAGFKVLMQTVGQFGFKNGGPGVQISRNTYVTTHGLGRFAPSEITYYSICIYLFIY